MLLAKLMRSYEITLLLLLAEVAAALFQRIASILDGCSATTAQKFLQEVKVLVETHGLCAQRYCHCRCTPLHLSGHHAPVSED